MSRSSISIVIPSFNEEKNIPLLYEGIIKALKVSQVTEYELLFVNDGSTDGTLGACMDLQEKDKRVKIINFTRNFGHQVAMTAGIDIAKNEGVIIMDADLQHPPKHLPEMIKSWQEGYDLVSMRAKKNKDYSFLQKFMIKAYFWILNFLSDIKIPEKSPDFRLIDRKYVDRLKMLKESERMLRGLLSWIGIKKSKMIEFTAPPRIHGETKYGFRKSFRFAIDGLVQLTTKPLRLALYLGFFAAFCAFCLGAWTIWDHFASHQLRTGYATIVTVTVFIGAVNLIVLGIVGEYIGRIHIDVKRRPLYFADIIDPEKEK